MFTERSVVDDPGGIAQNQLYICVVGQRCAGEVVDLVKECLRGEFCHLVDIPVDAGYRWGGQLAPEHIVKSDDGNIARTVFSQLPQRLEKKHSQPVSAGDDSGGEIPGDAFLNIQADGITGLIQIDLRDAGTAQGMVGGEKCPLISGNLVLFGEAVCFSTRNSTFSCPLSKK